MDEGCERFHAVRKTNIKESMSDTWRTLMLFIYISNYFVNDDKWIIKTNQCDYGVTFFIVWGSATSIKSSAGVKIRVQNQRSETATLVYTDILFGSASIPDDHIPQLFCPSNLLLEGYLLFFHPLLLSPSPRGPRCVPNPPMSTSSPFR